MHNHVKKIIEMIQRKELNASSVANMRVDIFHDDCCALLNRRGECDCEPVVKCADVIPVTGRKNKLNRQG